MWICLNKAFYSVVQDKNEPSRLLVRARRAQDISKCFPDAKVIANVGTDYKYRAFVSREDVAKAITNEIMNIDYSNFKSSVKNVDLHNAYMRVWHVMNEIQE
jgi:hypothetical protein